MAAGLGQVGIVRPMPNGFVGHGYRAPAYVPWGDANGPSLDSCFLGRLRRSGFLHAGAIRGVSALRRGGQSGSLLGLIPMAMTDDVELRCTFCGKGRLEVPRLVASEVEGLAICEECVGTAMQVLARSGWVPPTVEIRFGVRFEG